MFGGPSCPNCGNRLLVRKVRTGRFHRGHTLVKYDFHRCYRCLTTFGPDEPPADAAATATPAPSNATDATSGVLRDVHLELEDEGAKTRVESFVLELENVTPNSLTVDRVVLAFDDGEETAAPIEPTPLDPGETASLEVRRSWIHRDQHAVTIDVRADGEVAGRDELDLEEYRTA